MPQAASLSAELRSLVKRSVALLGEVIREELGAPAYQRIEALRSRMTAVRGLGEQHEASYSILREELEGLERLSARERIELALAFTLMLELMNACENAYRTWRLRAPHAHAADNARPHAIIYVLTAHPTESRSPETIAVFREILQALVGWLDAPASRAIELRLRNLLKLAWRLSPSRTRKPSVRNEAEAIFSMVLQDEALASLIAANRELCSVYLRTWVGGDKDGHPGVDEKTLQQSLAASRARLLRFFESGLARVRAFSERVRDAQLGRELKSVAAAAAALRQLTPGDGGRVARLRARLKGLRDVHPAVSDLRLLLRVFPGLVIPLELRESSELLLEAARGEPRAIARMVRWVRELSRGGDAKWYARGLIISMASSIEHVRAGCAVVRRELGALNLPVIPLLEQGAALEGGTELALAMLREPEIAEALRGSWAGLLELMVGYSDSAKEMGVLQSRLSIARAIHAIDRLPVFGEGLARPLFFHGSGGSTNRGGGSIEEQTAWWPESALANYKATLQGETIERSFASPESRGGAWSRSPRACPARRRRAARRARPLRPRPLRPRPLRPRPLRPRPPRVWSPMRRTRRSSDSQPRSAAPTARRSPSPTSSR